MINANDLRIGNLVDFEGKVCKVLGIDSQNTHKDKIGSVQLEEHHGTWLANIDPIPLTPEILEMAGFENVGILNDGSDMEFQLNVVSELRRAYFGTMSNDLTVFLFDSDNTTIGMGAIYLHQLQNLYFALTNQELFTNAKL